MDENIAKLQADHGSRLLGEIQAVQDPVARIRTINEAISRNGALNGALAKITRASVREMLGSGTQADVARQLGISRARVNRILGG